LVFVLVEFAMSRIVRTETSAIYSKAVEYHGFVYTQGMVARDASADIKGQVADVLAQVDALLARTATAAAKGEFELFKTTNRFDSTAQHPDWLGNAPAA